MAGKLEIIQRILKVLNTEGPIKKTPLANKTNLNYTTLVKYLKHLDMLNFIEEKTILEPKKIIKINITRYGQDFLKKLDSKL